jgi:hypothetical protein
MARLSEGLSLEAIGRAVLGARRHHRSFVPPPRHQLPRRLGSRIAETQRRSQPGEARLRMGGSGLAPDHPRSFADAAVRGERPPGSCPPRNGRGDLTRNGLGECSRPASRHRCSPTVGADHAGYQ